MPSTFGRSNAIFEQQLEEQKNKFKRLVSAQNGVAQTKRYRSRQRVELADYYNGNNLEVDDDHVME